MPTVILCRPLHASGMALLEARHDVIVRTLNRPSQSELAAAMPGAHAVLVGLEMVDEALLARSPDLKVVSRFGAGYDTVDIPACTRRGVVVGVTNGGNDLSVAEHTMMLLLAVARRTIEMDASGAPARRQPHSTASACACQYGTCSDRSKCSGGFAACSDPVRRSNYRSPTDAFRPMQSRSGSHSRDRTSSVWLEPICGQRRSRMSLAKAHHRGKAIRCGLRLRLKPRDRPV
jgi:hypothetical protein